MKKRVLVVDDSRFNYEDMKALLESTEFEVVGYCLQGEDVVKAYPVLKPDIVSMDIILPGIDGLEASELLLAAYPDAKIVMVTSLDYEETEERAKEIGVKEFVFKPFDGTDLVRAFRSALGEAVADDDGEDRLNQPTPLPDDVGM